MVEQRGGGEAREHAAVLLLVSHTEAAPCFLLYLGCKQLGTYLPTSQDWAEGWGVGGRLRGSECRQLWRNPGVVARIDRAQLAVCSDFKRPVSRASMHHRSRRVVGSVGTWRVRERHSGDGSLLVVQEAAMPDEHAGGASSWYQCGVAWHFNPERDIRIRQSIPIATRLQSPRSPHQAGYRGPLGALMHAEQDLGVCGNGGPLSKMGPRAGRVKLQLVKECKTDCR